MAAIDSNPLAPQTSLWDSRAVHISDGYGSAWDGHLNQLDTDWNMTYDDPPAPFDGVYAWTLLDLGQDTTYVASGTDTQKTSAGTKSTFLGFRPKAMIFATASQTTKNSNVATDGGMSIGFADGTNNVAIYGGGEDGSNPFNTNRYHADGSCLIMADYTDTVNAEATCTFTGDGFTLDWTTADATARDFIYLAFSDELGADFVPQIYRRL
jgi:hypothetical protein